MNLTPAQRTFLAEARRDGSSSPHPRGRACDFSAWHRTAKALERKGCGTVTHNGSTFRFTPTDEPTPAMDYDTLTRWYEEKISAAATLALHEMKRNPARRWYLWFRCGDILASPDTPPAAWGMEIVTPEPIPSNRDYAGVRAWVWEQCRRVECLPG